MASLERVRTTWRSSRTAQSRAGWTHASSYAGLTPSAFVHRARLRRLQALLGGLDLSAAGLLVDLGCSDGFVLARLLGAGAVPPGWRVAGYDAVPNLVAAAGRRSLAGAQFGVIDLNDAGARTAEPADVVICLETIEHVGDYRSALEVVAATIRPGGWLVLSMPNEIGLAGLLKLGGRPLLRRQPYRGVLTDRATTVRYAAAVGLRRDIEWLRRPPRSGWGPHLGFDHRVVADHIRKRFVEPGEWVVERDAWSAGRANRFLVVRRLA